MKLDLIQMFKIMKGLEVGMSKRLEHQRNNKRALFELQQGHIALKAREGNKTFVHKQSCTKLEHSTTQCDNLFD